jgi:Copper binding periplasmic protein CusF
MAMRNPLLRATFPRDSNRSAFLLSRKGLMVAYAAGILSAGAALTAGLPTRASADELCIGLVTKVYRANAKIGVQLLDNAPVGASGAVIDFDVLDGLPFDNVEPGDRLKFNVEQIGGVWTITRFQRQ